MVTDNSKNRLHDVFFYGLYMDRDILEQKGVQPRNPRLARADNFELRIGNKATLLRAPGKEAYGIVYSLMHSEINTLYWGSGLDEYAAEALLVETEGQETPVLCCILIEPPGEEESNQEYQQRLEYVMKRLGLLH